MQVLFIFCALGSRVCGSLFKVHTILSRPRPSCSAPRTWYTESASPDSERMRPSNSRVSSLLEQTQSFNYLTNENYDFSFSFLFTLSGIFCYARSTPALGLVECLRATTFVKRRPSTNLLNYNFPDALY